MSQSKPVIPRFTIVYWTDDSTSSFVRTVNTEDDLLQQLKELQQNNDVVAIASYGFLNAQRRTVQFTPLSPT